MSYELTLDTVDEAVTAFAAGELVVVVDHADREDEGDLVCAAETATTEQLAFMIRHTSGIICAPMPDAEADHLGLPLMTRDNEEELRTAFTVSTDARHGTTTGVSAAERAHTLRILADPASGAAELVRPGHVFPLRYAPGGVLTRPGHTEATVDLALLAGRRPVGVLAELVNDDGTMMRGTQLRQFADDHGLRMISIEDLIEYRKTRGE
jgi:3,4-dihydroxy 2-butanone 4-phosphate synthase / GTP cyclohydrolase II